MSLPPTLILPEVRVTRAYLCRLIVVAGFVCGILLSKQVWESTRNYPLAPVLSGLPVFPPAWLSTVTVPALIVLLLLSLHRSRWMALPALLFLSLLVITDYTRLQPWVYQYALILGAVLFRRSSEDALDATRIVIVAVYMWSGLQKLTPQFAHSVFPWLLTGVGVSVPAGTSASSLAIMAACTETALGIGLLHPRTRTAAVIGIVGMHAVILAAIGPFGHDWNSVVWPWNVALAALVSAAFLWEKRGAYAILRPQGRYRWCIYILCIFFPALSFLGWWDSYLSFSLYSGNIDNAVLVLQCDAAQDLSLPVGSAGCSSRQSVHVSLQDWALEEMNVPPYPEARVYRSIAAALCASAARRDVLELIVYPKSTFLNAHPSARRFTCSSL